MGKTQYPKPKAFKPFRWGDTKRAHEYDVKAIIAGPTSPKAGERVAIRDAEYSTRTGKRTVEKGTGASVVEVMEVTAHGYQCKYIGNFQPWDKL